MAKQKRLLDEALRPKQPSEADLIQKIRRELAAEAAARNPESSQKMHLVTLNKLEVQPLIQHLSHNLHEINKLVLHMVE